MKNKIIEITNIKIKLPNKEIELTSEEARKVYNELSQLFNLETETRKEFKDDLRELKKIMEEKNPVPYVPYYPPIIIREPIQDPCWPPWHITCSAVGITKNLDITIK